jgi:hypothetical protein
VAGRLEQGQPLDLSVRNLLQQAIDEPMMEHWLQRQQPPC